MYRGRNSLNYHHKVFDEIKYGKRKNSAQKMRSSLTLSEKEIKVG